MTTINGLEQGRAWAEKRRAQRHAEGKLLDFEAMDKIASVCKEADAGDLDEGTAIDAIRYAVGCTGRETS